MTLASPTSRALYEACSAFLLNELHHVAYADREFLRCSMVLAKDREIAGEWQRLVATILRAYDGLPAELAELGDGPLRPPKRERVTVVAGPKAFYLKAPYSLKKKSDELGGVYQPEEKAYRFEPTPVNAARLVEFCDGLLSSDRYVPTVPLQVVELAQSQREFIAEGRSTKEAEELEEIPLTAHSSWLHQRRAFHFSKDKPGVMLAMEMGPQPADTPILRPNGSWTPLGRIRAGSYVIGSGGFPVRVEANEWRGRLPIWECRFSDQSTTRCAGNHLWSFNNPADLKKERERRVPVGLRTATLAEIVTRGWANPQSSQIGTPLVSPVAFESRHDDPEYVHAYIAGYLAARGRSMRFDFGLETIPLERAPSVEVELLFEIAEIPIAAHSMVPAGCHVAEVDLWRDHPGRVPPAIALGPIGDRRRFLGAVVDELGHCHNAGGTIVRAGSEEFADDIIRLALLLGGMAERWHGQHEVRLRMPENPFIFNTEERDLWSAGTRQLRRWMIEATDLGEEVPCHCLTVEAEDGLYVTEDCIVTHNSGKTKVAVDLMQNAGARTALVVAPSSVVPVWPKEFGVHATIPHEVLALPRKKSVKERTALADDLLKRPTDTLKVIVINYEAAHRDPFAKWALGRNWDFVIGDEAHRFKTGSSVTSRFMAKLGRRADRRLALTGTPMAHSVLDLFGQFRFLDPTIYGTSFTKFRGRYAVMGGYGGYEVLGFHHTEEMMELYRSIAFEVGAEALDLPPESDVSIPVELSPRARKFYRQMETTFIAELESGALTASNALVKLLRLQQLTGGFVLDDHGTPNDVDDSKARALTDLLTDIEPPVVVFYRFSSDSAQIAEVTRKLDLRYGEVSGKRKDLSDRATFPEATDVLAVQLSAGGLGIDLTRAHHGIYWSTGFSLADYLQSRARLQRPGQNHPVVFHHLVATATVDETVAAALENRQDTIKAILATGL